MLIYPVAKTWYTARMGRYVGFGATHTQAIADCFKSYQSSLKWK